MFLVSINLLAGCAVLQLKTQETSGFFKNYSGFEPCGANQPNLVYLNPGRDFGPYNKLFLFLNVNNEQKIDAEAALIPISPNVPPLKLL